MELWLIYLSLNWVDLAIKYPVSSGVEFLMIYLSHFRTSVFSVEIQIEVLTGIKVDHIIKG